MDGYACDDQEYEIGVYACGTPVFDHTGTVVASVSVAIPVVRYYADRKESLIDRIVDPRWKSLHDLGIILRRTTKNLARQGKSANKGDFGETRIWFNCKLAIGLAEIGSSTC